MNEERREVVIIGGGPAGSALGALLAAAGHDVALLEKDFFPRPKLCGEFLSMESRRLLLRIGCLDEVLAREPARLRACRFYAPSGRSVELSLGGEALGLSREVFDDVLLRHARRRGADTREGVRADRVEADGVSATVELESQAAAGGPERRRMRASRVVAAYGRRSKPDRALGRSFITGLHPYAGLQRHHRPASSPEGARLTSELAGVTEVHFFDGGYGGLTFVEGGRVNVCLLLHRRLLKMLSSPKWEAVAGALERRSPSLAARLAALEPEPGPALAVAQLDFRRQETHAGPILFLGDAAAMIAPLCGDGQAMALRGAVLLADEFSRGGADAASLGPRWDAVWRRDFARRLLLGRALQSLLLKPAACEVAIRTVGLFPRLGAALIKATRD